MAAGLQIFNAKGEVTFDTNDVSYVLYGYGYTDGLYGEIEDDKIDENTFICAYYYDTGTNYEIGQIVTGSVVYNDGYSGRGTPLFKITNGKIIWQYNSSMGIGVKFKFFYGGTPK